MKRSKLAATLFLAGLLALGAGVPAAAGAAGDTVASKMGIRDCVATKIGVRNCVAGGWGAVGPVRIAGYDSWAG